jgi:hypothetical protein
VYRVDRSKDCSKSGEALSTSDLKSLSSLIASTTPVESLRIQILMEGSWAFLSFERNIKKLKPFPFTQDPLNL